MRFPLIKFAALSVLVSLALSACGGNSNDGPAQTPPVGPIGLSDVTDRHQCSGPSTASIYSRWISKTAGANGDARAKFTTTTDLSRPGLITITRDCVVNHEHLRASATAQAVVGASVITITSNGTNSEHAKVIDGGIAHACAPVLRPMSVSYQLVGRCMLLNHEGHTSYNVLD